MGLMEQYLEDPFLSRMFEPIRAAGALRSVQIDITHACNIRCTGCYFFAEELDRFRSPKDEGVFDEFVEKEKNARHELHDRGGRRAESRARPSQEAL